MKPIRRTEVITIMAACAMPSVFAQPASVDDFAAQTQMMKAQAKAMADDAKQLSQDLNLHLDIDGYKGDAWRGKVDAMRDMSEYMALDATHMVEAQNWKGLEDLVLLAQDIAPKAPMAPMAPMPPKVYRYDSGGGSYESGKNALDDHKYEKAVEIFDRVINGRNPSTRADGAYYWKAYALNKLGKSDEALASLGELSKQFPQSSWLNDAKALQAEVQQAKGQPVSPENQADEDLKLYAINALIN